MHCRTNSLKAGTRETAEEEFFVYRDHLSSAPVIILLHAGSAPQKSPAAVIPLNFPSP